MRTPAVHVGSQLLDFLKNRARLRLFENRDDHMPLSLKNRRAGLFEKILTESVSQVLTAEKLATD
jgi:hypothetical protein